MKYARGQGNAPPELELAFMCGDEHLPDAGGVLDQDYRLIITMRFLRMVHSTMNNAPKYQGKAIHNMPVSYKRTVNMLNKLGLWNPSMSVVEPQPEKPVKGIGA